MLKRSSLSAALAAVTLFAHGNAASAASTGVFTNFNFSKGAQILGAAGLVPDICVPNPLTGGTYCITWTQMTGMGSMADLDQLGEMAGLNLVQRLAPSENIADDLSSALNAVTAYNEQYPSQQGTAIASYIAQSRDTAASLQAQQLAAIKNMQQSMYSPGGSEALAQTQADMTEQIIANQQLELQLEAAKELQEQKQVANAEYEATQMYDVGAAPTAGYGL